MTAFKTRKEVIGIFIDLEKAFDRVPRQVLWWAMRKLGVEEWIVRLVQALYDGAKCRVRVNHKLGQPFSVKVGLHQGSVLSPLLFIIVLEALSMEFFTGCPWLSLAMTLLTYSKGLMHGRVAWMQSVCG